MTESEWRSLERDQTQLSDLLEELQQRLSELDTPSSYKPFQRRQGNDGFSRPRSCE